MSDLIRDTEYPPSYRENVNPSDFGTVSDLLSFTGKASLHEEILSTRNGSIVEEPKGHSIE